MYANHPTHSFAFSRVHRASPSYWKDHRSETGRVRRNALPVFCQRSSPPRRRAREPFGLGATHTSSSHQMAGISNYSRERDSWIPKEQHCSVVILLRSAIHKTLARESPRFIERTVLGTLAHSLHSFASKFSNLIQRSINGFAFLIGFDFYFLFYLFLFFSRRCCT